METKAFSKEDEELFLAIGLKPEKVKDTLKSQKTTENLKEILNHVKVTSCDPKTGTLYYSCATCLPETIEKHRLVLAELIANKKITKSSRFDLALDYLKANANAPELNVAELEKACGVGVVITDKQIQDVVDALFKEKEEELKKYRYCVPISKPLLVILID